MEQKFVGSYYEWLVEDYKAPAKLSWQEKLQIAFEQLQYEKERE